MALIGAQVFWLRIFLLLAAMAVIERGEYITLEDFLQSLPEDD